jgi:hypothetical protein
MLPDEYKRRIMAAIKLLSRRLFQRDYYKRHHGITNWHGFRMSRYNTFAVTWGKRAIAVKDLGKDRERQEVESTSVSPDDERLLTRNLGAEGTATVRMIIDRHMDDSHGKNRA